MFKIGKTSINREVTNNSKKVMLKKNLIFGAPGLNSSNIPSIIINE